MAAYSRMVARRNGYLLNCNLLGEPPNRSAFLSRNTLLSHVSSKDGRFISHASGYHRELLVSHVSRNDLLSCILRLRGPRGTLPWTISAGGGKRAHQCSTRLVAGEMSVPLSENGG